MNGSEGVEALLAKEIWVRGCQSRVATLSVNGLVRRVFIVLMMCVPSCTAREPSFLIVNTFTDSVDSVDQDG